MFRIVLFLQRTWLVGCLGVSIWGVGILREGYAQATTSQNSPSKAQATVPSTVDASILQDLVAAANSPQEAAETGSPGMDFMSLLVKGGVFMIPIALVSLIVVMFIFERLIGLRSGKLIPRTFVRKMRQLSLESASIDPRVAYGYCSDHPSATANVVRAVLLRAGRPQSEVAAAAAEVSQREADKAFGGVRWLYFCAGVAPLLGLLGTVWGLIRAFHDLTLLGPMESRAEFLGRGIYEALVTTLAGLVVAIPAALAAHFFEGRILRVFRSIEELAFSLIPKLERFEGRVRFDPIGRELVARNIDPAKKPVSTSHEGTHVNAVPPIQTAGTQTAGTQSHPPHASTIAPVRKSISKS
jgi:biopolymer transport protein ExbB